MPFLGTNTYLVGEGRIAVIDPGPADKRHLEAIAAATKGERVTHIVVTHSHRDHCEGARPLQEMLGGELVAYGPTGSARGAGAPGLGSAFVDAGFVPDRQVEDGDVIKAPGFALDVIHTPGHAPDHLCLALAGKRIVFTGDHVMGWNTTVIAPPEGNMAEFLASMEILLKRNDKLFLPAHGGRIQTPQRVVKAYIMHRQWREQTILACLKGGPRTIPEIVAKIHAGLDADLKTAAALSVFAHLQYLIERGLAETGEAPTLQGAFALSSASSSWSSSSRSS